MFTVYIEFTTHRVGRYFLSHCEAPDKTEAYALNLDRTMRYMYLLDTQEHAEDIVQAIMLFYGYAGPDYEAPQVYHGRSKRVFVPAQFEAVFEEIDDKVDLCVVDVPFLAEMKGLPDEATQRKNIKKGILFAVTRVTEAYVKVFTL